MNLSVELMFSGSKLQCYFQFITFRPRDNLKLKLLILSKFIVFLTILKPIYALQERHTVMHSKLGISQCMIHTAYRNSLRPSSSRKPNYPEYYFYKFFSNQLRYSKFLFFILLSVFFLPYKSIMF